MQRGATLQITSGFGQNARNNFHHDVHDDDDHDNVDNDEKMLVRINAASSQAFENMLF